MEELSIGARRIGADQPVFVIAEIGVNHNGSVERAKELVRVAAQAGVDAVKFQKRSLPHVYQKEILDNPNLGEQSFQYMIPLLREFELSEEAHRELQAYSHSLGLMYLCTAFDPASLAFVDGLGVPAHKVASPDMTNLPLIGGMVATGKPLLVSVGMSVLEEVDVTVGFLKERKARFALLHCNSTYPAPVEDLNLRFIQTLRERYGVPVGYSGHERGIAMSMGAVALGARVLERHITLDRFMEGPDHAASLEPKELIQLVADVRDLEQALGTGNKIFNRGEVLNREVLGKSLVAAADINKGTAITEAMVVTKSPGKGVSPQRLGELVGRTAPRHIRADEAFTEEDLGISHHIQVGNHFRRPWGFKARFHNLDDLLPHGPRLLEFHFSDKDLEYDYQGPKLEQALYIHAPEYWYRQMVDLCAEDEAIRFKSIEVIQQTIDKARQMARYFRGTPKIIVHMGGHGLAPLRDNARLLYNAENSLRRLRWDGVTLYPENVPPLPWYFAGQYYQNAFAGPEDMRDFCTTMGLEMCLDLSHAQLYSNAFHMKIGDYVQRVASLVRHIHIADGAGTNGEGLQIGDGEIDFTQVLGLLEQQEYSWVPEIWRGHQEHARGFLVALERLSAYPTL